MSLVQELYRRLGNIFFEIDRFFPALVRNQSILEEQKNTKQYKNDDIRLDSFGRHIAGFTFLFVSDVYKCF
jgi:hypothetical protein